MTQPNPYILAAENPPALLSLLRNSPALASTQDDHGYSLLHAAASYNHPDLLRTLVKDYNVDINLPDEDGETCLFVTESVDVAKCLIEELGIDYNRRNNDGLTAQETIANDDSFPEVAAYLSVVMGVAGGGGGDASSSNDTQQPSLPPNVRVNVDALPEQEANAGSAEADPVFRRRIEELASREDFGSEAAQSELRSLVMDAVNGVSVDGQGRDVRQKTG